MYQSSATIYSEHSPKYLTTLCRHFARKVPAQWSDTEGIVNFPMGNCQFKVVEDKLHMEINCTSNELTGLHIVKQIVGKHIEMFSRRETLKIDWKDTK